MPNEYREGRMLMFSISILTRLVTLFILLSVTSHINCIVARWQINVLYSLQFSLSCQRETVLSNDKSNNHAMFASLKSLTNG